MGPEERDLPLRRRSQPAADAASANVAGGGGRSGVPSSAPVLSPVVRRSLWHERTAWLLLLYAATFGYGLMQTMRHEIGTLNFLFGTALVCASIMACVGDSLLAGKAVPYSWRFAMFLFAPLLPVTSALVAWRARRLWGLLAVGANLLLLGGTFLAGMLAGMLVAAVRLG